MQHQSGLTFKERLKLQRIKILCWGAVVLFTSQFLAPVEIFPMEAFPIVRWAMFSESAPEIGH